MSSHLAPLLQLQRFFYPGLFALVGWAVWRTVVKRDVAVGLALYLGLVIIVDGFLNTGIYLPGFAKGSVRYSEVCALFMLTRRPSGSLAGGQSRASTLLIGMYFSLLFVSVFRSEPLMGGVAEFRQIVIPQIVAFALALRGLGSPAAYRRFFLAFTALIILIGLFTFWDLFFDIWLMRSDTLLSPHYWMNRKHGRFGSFFLNPNYMGGFAVLVFPAAFVQALRERQAAARLMAWVGLLALVFALVETQSRGPLLGFGLTLSVMTIVPGGGVSRKRRLGFLALFIAVFSLFMPGFYKHASERFRLLDKERSVDEVSRQSVWNFTVRIILDHPLAGIGFGERQFVRMMRQYGFEERYRAASLDNPHNSYLQAAVYAGVPAVLAFLTANALLLLRAVRRALADNRDERAPLILGLAVGITGFLAVIYPDMHLFAQSVACTYWVFFGLLSSLAGAVPEAESP